MNESGAMHPLVALMRRYCIDYTNSHDLSWHPDLFTPDYTVHINGWHLQRDESYAPATRALFERAPGLGLTVHELVLNGDRLCMRFSEHAAMPRPDGGRQVAVWRGIGLYRWDGQRLTENYVEQDFLGQREQLRSGAADPLEPPHPDPWLCTSPEAPDEAAEAVATAFVRRGELHDAHVCHIDSQPDGAAGPLVLTPEHVVVNDLFSAGRRVAVHATVHGPYRGGIAALNGNAVGTAAKLQVAALLKVDPRGVVEEVRAVTSRDAVFRALR